MGLKETLRTDLTQAIRSRDELTSGTIRMILTAITNEEVSGKSARELSEAEIITVLSREAKKRREAAEAFETGERPEKAALERAEGEVIAKYLPEQLSDEKLKEMIAEAIAETGASGPAGMGLVMKVLSPKIAGKADGGTVSAAVREALSK
ncbi:MAG: GatB/YqeY domain-containing protein [Candidatus Nanopelagicaceae bacterium]